MKRTLIACGFLALAASGSNAGAAPLGTEKLNGLQTFTEKVAMVCIRDDRGWHYMRGSRRIVCRPARPSGRLWGWRCEGPRCGWWHRNERRWHD